MPPLKIALISDCYHPRLGGIELQVRDLGVHLEAAGNTVEVITPVPGDDVVEGRRVHRLDVPLLPFDQTYKRETFTKIRDIVVDGGFDVAHFHSGVMSPSSYGGTYEVQKVGVPTVVTSHCIWGYATPLFARAEKIWRWSAWPVVYSAVSDVAASDIRRATRMRREILVLPNGIDTGAWTLAPEPRDPDTVTITSTMRLAPRKRPRHLIPMVAALRERTRPGVRLRVVIIGDGPQREKIQRLVHRYRLEDVVTLTGTLERDEIRRWLARSDLYVAPANLESFGIAALEARCAGVPVVAKSCTGIREFVEHGREGYLCDTDDEMVVNLAHLVNNPDIRQAMASHNRTTAPSCNWDDVVKRNLHAYEDATRLVGGVHV